MKNTFNGKIDFIMFNYYLIFKYYLILQKNIKDFNFIFTQNSLN